jgi:hypothetical protein
MAGNVSIKRIKYLRYCEDIMEIEHSNIDITFEIDITVELDDGSTYIVSLTTPKNLEYLMDQNHMNYFEPVYPRIIIKSLTKDIIIETIKAYVKKNDGYWLKLYHFADEIDPRLFQQLQAEAKKLDDYEYQKYKIQLDDKELKKLYVVYEGKDLEELDNS